ncbi:hypothetical protein NPIL_554671 [Nephila pilipes]|uniref:C2H2-type domain-containing protein n=1 Tax=Nephila pilipes TaxID=299642 RepID=A0A8X6UN26_NEPPI|nr:hypothetical protein NPIL_554671 [Nephila pilipes]
MEQELSNKSSYQVPSLFPEFQRISSSYSYQQAETDRFDASEQIISPSEFSLPSFGSAFRDKVPFYNFLVDPMHSVQDQLRDNQNSYIPLSDNHTNNGMCSSTTTSNTSEKSQEIFDRNFGHYVFPHRITDSADNLKDNCYEVKAMQNEVVPNIFVPQTHSYVEIESNETDHTKSFENFDKCVSRQLNSNESNLNCETCRKLFSNKSMLEKNLIINTDKKKFKCETCSKEYSSRSYLKQHLLIHEGRGKFICEICCCEYSTKGNLKQHRLIHEDSRNFLCEICNWKCSSKVNLKKHLSIHEGEKTFKCEKCHKEFSTQRNLKRHFLTHNTEKEFKCEICSREFSVKKYLKQHLHTHNTKKQFKCEICCKEFSVKQYLKKHLLIHAEEKKFKCGVCSKEFRRKKNLKMHFVIHTEEHNLK